jgi:hypothetical protein
MRIALMTLFYALGLIASGGPGVWADDQADYDEGSGQSSVDLGL